MALKDNLKENTFSFEDLNSENSTERFLVLHNDDINTFEHVIECLIKICKHDIVQAEQCAYIAHYKGKCEVKKGYPGELNYLKNLLISKGLSVTLE
ncbi:MAG: hypothetical protein Kow0068_26090 [Marinilabiliales bacterium]